MGVARAVIHHQLIGSQSARDGCSVVNDEVRVGDGGGSWWT